MKKYVRFIVFSFVVLLLVSCTVSFAAPSPEKIKNISVNDINLKSIDKNKVDDLKKVLDNIDIKSLDTSAIVDDINKSEVANGNLNSINTDAINMKEVIGIYDELSSVISNEEIADLIKDNKKVLTEAGVSKDALNVSEKMLRTFDSKAVIDIVQNDLDIDKLMEMYKKGASLEEILTTLLTETSLKTKLSIASKLLFSNRYVKTFMVILVIIAIYSIFITSFIFRKAGKQGFATLIPIYRDIVHLKICGLSPWLLLLVFIPIIGWLALMAVAIIGRFELSKKFGHGFLFGLGLLVLPTLFRTIIAFSSNEYIEDLYEED